MASIPAGSPLGELIKIIAPGISQENFSVLIAPGGKYEQISALSGGVGITGYVVDTRTLSGRGSPNSTVTVSVAGVSQGTTTSDASGNWSFVFRTPPQIGQVVTATGPVTSNPFTVSQFPVARDLLSGSRLQMTSQLITVASTDVYKQRWITMISPPWDVTDPCFAFAAWYANERPLGNSWTIEGAIIEINDVKTSMSFSGAEGVTIADGLDVWSDPIPVKIPANTIFRVGVADFVPAGQFRAGGGPVPLAGSVIKTVSNRGDTQISSTSTSQLAALKTNTTAAGTASGAATYDGLPIFMVAKPDGNAAIAAAKAVLIVGDSIAWGDRPNGHPYGIEAAEYGAISYIHRALNNATGGRVPFGCTAVPSTRYPDLTLSPTPVGIAIRGFNRRAGLMSAKGWPYDTIVCQMAINTITNSNATGAIADAKAAHAALKTYGGKRVVQILPIPFTSSVTEGGAQNYLQWSVTDDTKQTRQSVQSFDGLYTYLQGTPTDVDAVIEVANTVESTPGSRKWAGANQVGTLTADAAAGQKVMTINFVPLPGDILNLGTGASTVELRDAQTVVDNGNGTATVTLRQNISTARTSGTSVTGAYCADGLHLSNQGTRRVKVPVINAKVNGLIV